MCASLQDTFKRGMCFYVVMYNLKCSKLKTFALLVKTTDILAPHDFFF